MLRLDFNKVLDEYLISGEITAEDYEALDFTQEIIIQELKRAFARAKMKENLEKASLIDTEGMDTSKIPF